jgi:polyhydroxybutyrate depolymerase
MGANVDDVGFVGALLDHLEETLCINTDAVFATGLSNGAIMSYRLACQLADRVAAIAPVAGALELSSCTPSEPVSVMEIHGTADHNIPFFGGVGCGVSDTNFTSVPTTIDTMAEAEGCACRFNQSGCTSIYLVEGHGTCVSHGPCKDKSDVILCTMEGGGHTWPGVGPQTAGLGCNNTVITDFNTNKHIWAFFNATISPSAANSVRPSFMPTSVLAWLAARWW